MKRRPVKQLDERPSNARLRELYRERTGFEVPAFELPKLGAGSQVYLRIGNLTIEQGTGLLTEIDDRRTVILGNALRAVRDGNRLELVLGLAPRTKKNSTTLGIRQSPHYRKYRDTIISLITAVKAQLALPLPPRPATYNIAAVYYVDRWGERADRPGLDQGLYDALENAGVIENDWQFRTSDGTRIVVGDPDPRVEIIITPIEL